MGSVVGKMPNWEVTGKYDTVDERGRKRSESFCNCFLAKNKNDAVSQAKRFFAEMAKDDPAGKYKNFRDINAKPIK
ncbi:hypothetical protein SEA_ENYGMA_128 [Streptomyces phage Enygma]